MINIKPITIAGRTCLATEIDLPKTRLVSISTTNGYIMCGALDVHLLNTKLKDRKIIAGRAVGVHNTEELLAAPLESITNTAAELGIHVGMKGEDALALMLEHVKRPE